MKPPKRLFRTRTLSPRVLRLIDRLTEGNPGLRCALIESLGACSSRDFIEAFAGSVPHQRAALLVACRDAGAAIRDGKPCDLCSSAARHIRFSAVWPGEDFRAAKAPTPDSALLSFSILCGRCNGLSEPEHKRRVLDRYAALDRPSGNVYRPSLIGPKVGQAGPLPRNHRLEECADCRSMIWIDGDQVDAIVGEIPLYYCMVCAGRRLQDGRAVAVPTILTGG